jgi:hypothetical protein
LNREAGERAKTPIKQELVVDHEAEQIQAALTHDQHFVQTGFETLLR